MRSEIVKGGQAEGELGRDGAADGTVAREGVGKVKTR